MQQEQGANGKAPCLTYTGKEMKVMNKNLNASSMRRAKITIEDKGKNAEFSADGCATQETMLHMFDTAVRGWMEMYEAHSPEMKTSEVCDLFSSIFKTSIKLYCGEKDCPDEKNEPLAVSIQRFGKGATFHAKGSGDIQDTAIMLSSTVIGFAKMAQKMDSELTDEETIKFLRDTFEDTMQNFLEKRG